MGFLDFLRRKPPIRDAAAVGTFVDENAAFLMQKGLYEYSRARDLMLLATDTDTSPWHVVRSDDKRRARLNCIAHLLGQIPYKRVKRTKIETVDRSRKHAYDDEAPMRKRRWIAEAY